MRIQRFGSLASILISLCLVSLPAAAQTGVLSGRVTDAGTGEPIAGAAVEVMTPPASPPADPAGRTQTDAAGRFRLAGLAPGEYILVVGSLGYAESRQEGVAVPAAGTATLEIRLTPSAIRLDEVTVSVGRKPEQALGSVAHVELVGRQDLEERPVVSPAEHLRSVPGVDLIQYGLQSQNIVTRGFNNLFSGALYTLTDYRIASVPSLRVNLLHLEPATTADYERMEVVLGPGAALYGPNTANGVLHILTRSPLDHQGTSASFAIGERVDAMASFRTAHKLAETFGVKLSGQYASGDEWRYIDPIEALARREALEDPAGCRASWTGGGVAPDEAAVRCTRVGERGFGIERFGFDARADWRPTEAWTAVASAGVAQTNGIELTGLGAAQAQDWSKYYGQLRASRGRLFGQVYLNGSDAGGTYLLQNGASIIDRSKLLVAQLQHGFALGDRQDFTYGVDWLRTMPDTEGTINGGNEGDDGLTEVGAYVQSETALTSSLELILAGRVDDHSALDDVIFSPRAGLVFSPTPRHSLRATVNSAFETPSSLNLFLDIHGGAVGDPTLAALGYGVRAQGPGTAGIDMVGDDGAPLGMRSPFNPAGAGQLLPTDPSVLWQIAVGALQTQGVIDGQTALDMMSLDASGLGINALDPNTRQVTSLAAAGLGDVPGLRESRQTTLELGYKGLLAGDRIRIAGDVWHTRKSDFISPLFVQTPLLLLDGASTVGMLVPYFMGEGMGQEQATATALAIVQGDPAVVGDGVAEIPLAVASAPGVSAVGADLMATFRNFGEVELWGADLAADVMLGGPWRVGLSASWVSDDHFRIPLDGVEQILALNAPTLKGSTSVGYRDAASGFNAEARVRYHNEFPASSAGHAGLACLGVEDSPACVDDAVLTDLTLGYRLPGMSGATVQLSVQNLFDTAYRSFVRVPEMGRMALLRVAYEF